MSMRERIREIKKRKAAIKNLQQHNTAERRELLVSGWTTAGPLDEVLDGPFDLALSLRIDEAQEG